MTPKACIVCGKDDDGRMTRGACNACYQRVKKAGALDTLAPKRQPGYCARGHNLDEAGRDTRGACRVCSRERSRERHAAKLAGEGREPVNRSFADGTCKRGHDVTDPANLYVRGNGKRTCRECALRRSNPNAERRIPAKRDPDRVRGRAPRTPREPRPKSQPKVETQPRPKAAPKPKPVKSKLPPGWDRVTPPKVYPKPGKAGGGGAKLLEVTPTPATDPATLARAARTLSLWFADAPEIAAELADALGLEVA